MRGDPRFLRLFAALTVLITLAVLGRPDGANLAFPSTVLASSQISVPFTDDVEDADFALSYWVTDAPWGRTTDDSRSATHSWTDSPFAFYDNNRDVSLTLASPIDLTGSSSPQLKFWHHYRLESGFDYGYVEVSTSGAGGP